MSFGGWRPDAVAAALRVDEMCDSIDLAYQAHEFPLMVVSSAAPEADSKELIALLRRIGNHGVVVPSGFTVEFIGPGVPQHPWELSRWADDGGRV